MRLGGLHAKGFGHSKNPWKYAERLIVFWQRTWHPQAPPVIESMHRKVDSLNIEFNDSDGVSPLCAFELFKCVHGRVS